MRINKKLAAWLFVLNYLLLKFYFDTKKRIPQKPKMLKKRKIPIEKVFRDLNKALLINEKRLLVPANLLPRDFCQVNNERSKKLYLKQIWKSK